MKRGEGLVLKLSPLREVDEIVHLFTPDQGYLRVRAPGIRRMGAKHRGALQTLNHVTFRTITSKGFPILVDAEVLRSSSGTNLSQMHIAQSICRLVPRLIPENTPDPLLWNMVDECLSVIREARELFSRHLVSTFVLKFLHLHGMQPQLDRCAVCGKVLSSGDLFIFSRIRGGVVESPCMPETEAGIAIDRRTLEVLLRLQSASFKEIVEGRFAQHRKAHELIGEFIEWHLGISVSPSAV